MSLEDVVNEAVRCLSLPAWKATEFFLIKDSSWTGTASKAVGIFGFIIAAPFAFAGETLHFVSNGYFQRSYLSYESQAPKKEGMPQKFLNLNGCMFQGGLPVSFGGMSPAGLRMKAMADFLKFQNADVVCMQEVAFDPATQLIGKLKDHYRYFYYRVGPNPYQMESTLFWASKVPLLKDPVFIPFDIPGMQAGIRRGFFIAELEGCYVITTHLDPHAGAAKGEVRAKQIEVIVKLLDELTSKPVFLIGDLNIEPEDMRAQALLKANFDNFKEQDVLKPTEANATCFDNMNEVLQNPTLSPKWSVVDHILVKGAQALHLFQERIPTFDRSNLPAALSDHHAIVMTVQQKL